MAERSPAVPNWHGQTEGGCPRGDGHSLAGISDLEQLLDAERSERWLSAPRYRRYLGVAGGDHGLALETYLWNSRVAAAGIADLGHLEVALRNAYDRALSRAHLDWSIDDQSQVFRREQGVERARIQQQRRNKASLERISDARRGLSSAPKHGEVVAALTFGFWMNLTVPERTATFWNPMLHHAFPKRTKRAWVHGLVARTVKFRNRLAHNEPVFSTRTGLEERLDDVRELFQLLDPGVFQFVAAHSMVGEALRACPKPGLTTAKGLT